MLRRVLRAGLLAALMAVSAVPGLGWDETGHKVTGYIAWQQMTPEVRERVIKILLTAPEDAQLSTFYMPYGSQSEEARRRQFFMIATTWADIIKDKAFDTRYKKYNHNNWHYHDTLWMLKDGKFQFLEMPGDAGKLIEKLAEFDSVIRSPASDSDKAIAIAWLEHLIGDLHQPLHTTARAYKADDKGDQGGNLFSLTPKGTPGDRSDNLHRFWDSVIGRSIPNSTDTCDTAYVEPIAVLIMKRHPYDKLRDSLAPGKFEVWEKESVDIATTQLYRGLIRYEAPSADYKKRALEIGEERMALAGYRMGELFNEAFAAAK
jgi:hypothetical protein